MKVRRIVAIMGFAFNGKTTLADLMVVRWGFHKASFATAIKENVNPVLDRLGLDYKFPLDKERVRNCYVCVGEVMRAYNSNHWIGELRKRIPATGDVVIDDLRYPNEAAWVLAVGGLVVDVHRPGFHAANTIENASIADTRTQYAIPVIKNDILDDFASPMKEIEAAMAAHYK